MLTLNFDPFPLITTERLILRQVNNNDVNEIFFLRSNKEVLKYLDKPSEKSAEETLLFIKKITDLQEKNENILWAIVLKGSSKLIGTICFWNIVKENYRAEIGYVLHPDFQGKGIMQEAMSVVIDYGFSVMKLHSIEANVNPDNSSSIKLLERNNFVREAYFKENLFHDGKFVDTVIYSLVFPLENL